MAEVKILTSLDPEEVSAVAARLADERLASRLTAGEPDLWGPAARAEAAIRLAWTTLPETSRPLVPAILELRAELHAEGIDRVVLAGMGGSSLAPEVICAEADRQLTVLDTTDAAQVADALAGDLSRTVLVVSSKSGSTVETDSHRRIFEKAFTDAGINAASRIVVVTDPDSPLAKTAADAGYRRTFTAEPRVGGRYSALTAFGLVPAGLAGVDVGALLDEAAEVSATLATDFPDNPAITLAAALGVAHGRGAEKVVFADSGSGAARFADWVEQLIAESTGKRGVGLLPVVVESPDAPGFADAGPDATTVCLGPPAPNVAISVEGSLGARFLLWEYATALVGRLLGINPFDQPDVEAAKRAAREMLDNADAEPTLTDGPVRVHADRPVAGADSLVAVLRDFLDRVPEHGYLAVQAYLDRLDDASTALLRALLATTTGVQTTFGWGPRFLHSTGQYHKGGHPNGAFLQITGDVEHDLPVPGRPYTLGGLQLAQALGDGQVLRDRRRPVLRLHLTDRAAGLAVVIAAVQEIQRERHPRPVGAVNWGGPPGGGVVDLKDRP